MWATPQTNIAMDMAYRKKTPESWGETVLAFTITISFFFFITFWIVEKQFDEMYFLTSFEKTKKSFFLPVNCIYENEIWQITFLDSKHIVKKENMQENDLYLEWKSGDESAAESQIQTVALKTDPEE